MACSTAQWKVQRKLDGVFEGAMEGTTEADDVAEGAVVGIGETEGARDGAGLGSVDGFCEGAWLAKVALAVMVVFFPMMSTELLVRVASSAV